MKTYQVKVTTTYYVEATAASKDEALNWAIDNHLTESNGIYEEADAEVVSVLADTLADDVKVLALPLINWATTHEYASDLWERIARDVVEDVREATDYEHGEGFNETDVRYAIGRVLLKMAEDNYN